MGTHLLVYPFLSSGHLIPLLDLTEKLLYRGLTVTIIVTPNNLPLLKPLQSRHVSLHHLLLPSPELPRPPQITLATVIQSIRNTHFPLLLEWFRSHPSPPVAILSDFFFGWTHHLAIQLGIPRVVFSPSGALSFSVSAATWQDQHKIDHNPEDMEEEDLVSFPTVPNSPNYPWWQISSHYRKGGKGDPDWEYHKENTSANLSSWGILFNSFHELEDEYLQHLKREYFGDKRVWAVGPVLPPDDDDDDGDRAVSETRGGSSSVDCGDVMTWLDSKRVSSVVYVCFGSRAVLTPAQMEVLASGLDKSGVHFIWSVRQPRTGDAHVDYGTLPDGYEERVKGRGLVINGWAPQVSILRHRAVGVFLTHCGWNSVLEGISSGMVMLTWPMGADQFINANILVDQLGVGIRVGEATHRIPDPNELARIFVESVRDDRSERIKADKMREVALRGVIKGGNSDRDLEDFVRSLNGLNNNKVVVENRGDGLMV